MMEPTYRDPTLEDAPCPDCDGSGTVDVDDFDGRGEHVSRTEPCPTCGAAHGNSREDDEPDLERDLPDAEVDWDVSW